MISSQEQKSACSIVGRVYDIQGFSVQDGPGIRTTVFLKGCPLHCPWCHSVESQKFNKELSYTDLKCVGHEADCRCMEVCNTNAISLEPYTDIFGKTIHRAVIDRNKCNECFLCADECVADALTICGTDYSVDEVMRVIRSNMDYYKHSNNGGVTISGGECLWQPEFTRELLVRSHGLGIHTAVDTTGYVDWDVIESILPYTNLFLYDLKHMDSATHKTVIGVPNEKILENAKHIAEKGGKLQVRLPLIPLFNDSEDNLRKTAEFCKSLGDAVTEIQVLPYHRMGTAKTKKVRGADFKIFEATVPSDNHINDCVNILKEYEIKVVVH